MKLYLYDEITKEYIETIEAYIDPEETKIAGKEVYMYPANSTNLEPPLVGNNEIVLFENDNWVIKPDYRGLYQCNEDFIVTEIDKFGELEDGYIVITKEQADKIAEDNLYYVILDGEIVENPNYEEEQKQKERERLDNLSMTRGDVFEALILAKGLGKAQIRAMIEQASLDDITKALYLNRFDEALEFYRGYPIFDMLGQALNITGEMLDKFFETKDYKELIAKNESTSTDS